MPIPQRDQPNFPGPAGDRVGYYMVKVRRSASDPAGDLTGVIERLGSGEKREFRSFEELAKVVDEWSR